ncbi:SulP family inorganic anion transporter [Paenibacillus mendelii]|uniref:SulP family inorganic anion transporter n=1 Tax=Paenibacillus mendelii TaxID=206163 RepID=A0ABV6JE55_9BACL|nr:SulP family inorganic anion transporter [Paenibacillus mendelii]
MERFAGYNISALRRDLISGTIVGIIAIPLGMAFAIASGVDPEYGIYSTIVAGVMISLFGGSKFQIGGPTGAFIPILFGIVMHYGYDNLLLAGFMAGIILILLGVFRLGVLIAFIPRPVVTGFTAGIAVIIFSGQIANFLGLSGIEASDKFGVNMKEIALHLGTVNGPSVITAAVCLLIIVLLPRVLPQVPASLAGLIVSSTVAALFFQGKVATIGSAFGAIPSTLPQFHFPVITWDRIEMLLYPAFLIAVLGGIESLLSAVVADEMSGSKHHANRELIGQGIANMAAPLFGGIPATGAIARTATNIKSGAASPLSGVIHGIVVFLVLILLAPYASEIPLSSIAPLLMLVAWNMSERREFLRIAKTRTSDSFLLLITFLLTVWVNLMTAVEVGLILAVILFVKRMSDGLTVVNGRLDGTEGDIGAEAQDRECPHPCQITIEGPLFFGSSNRFEKAMSRGMPHESVAVVLQLDKMPYMDMTGEYKLAAYIQPILNAGGVVFVRGIQPQPLAMMKKTGLYRLIGENRFLEKSG